MDTRCISGPPGKPRPKYAGCLVEGFPGSVVAGASHQPVVAVPFHQQQVGMAARGYQTGQREAGVFRRIGRGQPGCVNVRLQVIDADEGFPQREGDGLGGVQPGNQRTGQTGAVGDRHHVHVLQPQPAGLHRLLQHRRQVADVLPRGHLRHHAAVPGMQLRLRRDDVGTQHPPVLHNPGRSLVAGCFDAQNLQCHVQSRLSKENQMKLWFQHIIARPVVSTKRRQLYTPVGRCYHSRYTSTH